MAEVLEEFDWNAAHRSRYPWGDWLDGRVWLLRQGEDFRATAESVRGSAKKAAEKLGIEVRARSRDGGQVIVIQAVRPPAGASSRRRSR